MKYIILIFSASISFAAVAQENLNEDGKSSRLKDRLNAEVALANNDSMLRVSMEPISVTAPKVFKNKKDEAKYWKLVRDVKIAYPYAKLINERLRYYEINLAEIEQKSKRKRLMKKVETELVEEYGKKLKNLSNSQADVLLKLIDRETGSTPYSLVQDLRGNLSATLWQGVSKIYGKNLKEGYDPNGDDKEIEEIINKIESGVI